MTQLVRRPYPNLPAPWLGSTFDLRTPLGSLLQDMLPMEPSTPGYPTLDVDDEDKQVRVTAELPGTARGDVHIEVSPGGDALTIRGEKRREDKREERGVRVSERMYGSFERAITLPSRVDPDKAEASLEEGVLTVTMPKAEGAAGPRRIEVR
jgi:HSP20 family protein